MTSIEIAEVTGKQHKNVMQAIRNMEPAWEKVNGLKFQLVVFLYLLVRHRKMEPAWEKITGLKFQLSTYKDPTGRTLPCENQRDWFIKNVMKAILLVLLSVSCIEHIDLYHVLPIRYGRARHHDKQGRYFST